MIYIVMGVSGSGKSTVGKMLAKELNLPFKDGDDYHPEKNIQKMSQGIPLTDQDRQNWLKLLAQKMENWEYQHSGAVLACSALKQQYRDELTQNPQLETTFVYLRGSYQLIYQRISARENHFMRSDLLQSQFEILEEPKDAITVELDHEPHTQLHKILEKMVCEI